MSGSNEWRDGVVRLLALATRLEGEGQYNLAKLARAAVDSLGRREAYQHPAPENRDELAVAVKEAVRGLSQLEVGEALLAAFERGAAAMSTGRLPLIHETPHPYVCRTCGEITLGEPQGKCPTCGAWAETYQRFLPVYWLDAYEPRAAMDQLRQTPKEVAALVEGLSEEALTLKPADGGWAIRNTISHLRDAQGVLSFRLDLFIMEERPKLESKAVFEWAANETQRPPTTGEILASYRQAREETLAKLESLPLADWFHCGDHEEFGVVTLRQQVSYFAAHELTHLPQINRLRQP